MVELSTLVNSWQLIRSFIQEIKERDRYNYREYNIALKSIYTAANETRLYLRRLQSSGRRKRDKEETLSRLWIDAALALRQIDNDLSYRCEIKAGYWADPEKWTLEEIRDARITLESMFEEARELLKE